MWKCTWGKQSKVATDDLTTTHGTVLQLVISVENKGHKLYIDNSHLQNFLKTSVTEWLVLVEQSAITGTKCQQILVQEIQ
jgi:hypothetical protein